MSLLLCEFNVVLNDLCYNIILLVLRMQTLELIPKPNRNLKPAWHWRAFHLVLRVKVHSDCTLHRSIFNQPLGSTQKWNAVLLHLQDCSGVQKLCLTNKSDTPLSFVTPTGARQITPLILMNSLFASSRLNILLCFRNSSSFGKFASMVSQCSWKQQLTHDVSTVS